MRPLVLHRLVLKCLGPWVHSCMTLLVPTAGASREEGHSPREKGACICKCSLAGYYGLKVS